MPRAVEQKVIFQAREISGFPRQTFDARQAFAGMRTGGCDLPLQIGEPAAVAGRRLAVQQSREARQQGGVQPRQCAQRRDGIEGGKLVDLGQLCCQRGRRGRQRQPRHQKAQFLHARLALPVQCLCPALCFALGRSHRNVRQAGRDPGGDFGGSAGQPVKLRAGRRQRRRWGRRRRLQFLPERRHRRRRGTFRRRHQNPEGVAETVEQPRPQYPVVGQRQQTRAQGQQVAGQVAAVHRRNVQGGQRLQRLRVVPVVEVAAMSLQRVQGAQGIGRALEQLAGREIAEVVGRKIRQQRHADVGRRGPMGDRGDAIFLVVVRRQPMLFRADEGVEERPGATRQRAQEKNLRTAQDRLAALQRTADPPDEQR
ncbi:MAG: hypothetical protein AW09_003508 [Candidatus Accumulibacter phosphatis]|uniref:Uncharacterized protein n=1 Tax=Candidatus Accumulibacter phosphatis TaxID=327160 RepID=A0A080LUK5_9PROT|nr:MAG: hypothetical protein AW09_003508 [Candidatus Accumulibacter phosphatis]